MHVGSSETFVFAAADETDPECSEFRRYRSVAETAVIPQNQYFIRCTPDILAIGGGGKGPAISVCYNMYVGSSTHCPTFESAYETLLHQLPGSSVELEGTEPRAPIERLELWLISEEYFIA